MVLSLALAAPVVAAEKKDDQAKQQVRRMQQAQRKLEQEKAQLAQEKAALEEALKASESKQFEGRRRAGESAKRAEQLELDLAEARTEKETLAAKLADAEMRLAELSTRQRATDAERRRFEQLTAQTKQSLTTCEGRNAKLHDQGLVLLEKYREKGCLESMLQEEPLTGIKRVEVENFLEDSRDLLDQNRLQRPLGQ